MANLHQHPDAIGDEIFRLVEHYTYTQSLSPDGSVFDSILHHLGGEGDNRLPTKGCVMCSSQFYIT